MYLGDFSQIQINLRGNQFTSLDEEVFRPLLESMSQGTGRLYIRPSKLSLFFFSKELSQVMSK